MSACPDMSPLLLEAEPDELRGLGASEVAVHIRACPRCARVAAVLLAETGTLDAYLRSPPAAHAVAAIIERATTETPPVGRALLRRPFVRRHRWWPLAAAAVAAGLLFLSRDRVPEPGVGPPLRTATAAPVVRPAPNQSVAVFQTDNPDITVLWFF